MNEPVCTTCTTNASPVEGHAGWMGVFSTDGFVPRWTCGHWPEWLGWLHIISDLAIFVAYAAIPASLFVLILRRRDVPLRGVVWLFISFILSCGLTHLLDAGMFYVPAYRFLGVLKVITAGVSLSTALVLIRLMPSMLALPAVVREHTSAKAEVTALRSSGQRLEAARDQLEDRSAMLTVRDRRFRRALESARVAAVSWSGSTGVIVWEIGLDDILDPTSVRGSERTWSTYLSPDEFGRLLKASESPGNAGGVLTIELEVRLAPDGRPGRVLMRAQADATSADAPDVFTGLVTAIAPDTSAR